MRVVWLEPLAEGTTASVSQEISLMTCKEALETIRTEVDNYVSGKTMFDDPRPDDHPLLTTEANLIERVQRIANQVEAN